MYFCDVIRLKQQKQIYMIKLILSLLPAALLLSMVMYNYARFRGIQLSKKRLLELNSLKSGMKIIISHPDYDDECIFLSRIDSMSNIVVLPFKNGIPKDRIVITNDQFIKLQKLKA